MDTVVVTDELTASVRALWLDYAWSVVNTADRHLGGCRALGGSPDIGQRHAPAWMRWPGYVGRRWQPGRGLLFIGSVHREFDIGASRRPDLTLLGLEEELIAANSAWRGTGRGPAADSQYLSRTQDAFSAMWRLWPRARVFSDVVDGLGLSTDQIAWTNLAKCQVFRSDRLTGLPLRANQEKLQLLCQQHFPIGSVVKALSPLETFVPVLSVAERATFPHGVSPVIYHGMNGTRDSIGPTLWVPEEIRRLRESMRSQA
jgi:hypothetical protein